MLKQRYFTGVDGGGTHSRGLVMDVRGRVVCQLRGKSSNVYKLGVLQAASNLAELIGEMTAKIPDFNQAATGICCGLAGVIEGQVTSELREAVMGLGAGTRVHLHNDAFLSCYAVAEGEPAIALISGTGSVAFAFDRDGSVVTGGGLGYLYGDEGSGFEMGSRGIRSAIAYAESRGPVTRLLEALLAQYALADTRSLPMIVNSPLTVSDFAKTVHEQAKTGDQESLRIIEQAARGLVELVSAVLARSDLAKVENLSVGLFGGCLTNMDLLRSNVIDHLTAMKLTVKQGMPSPELMAADIARKRYIAEVDGQ